jgi:hypothetical protein
MSYYDWLIANTSDPAIRAQYQAQHDANPLTNPLYESQFGGYLTQLGQLAGTYNTAREGAANISALSAKNSGLSDTTSVLTDQTVAGNDTLGTKPSMTYKIVMGPDGRAYRQAFMSVGAQVGARNWGGSEDVSRNWSARQDLNAQRTKLGTDLTTEQSRLTGEQGKEQTGITTNMNNLIGNYGKWKIDNAAASTQPSGANDDAGAPAAPTTTSFYRYGAKPNTSKFDQDYGAGNWKVGSRGKGKDKKFIVKVVR